MLRGASCCFALVLLAVLCASLLVFSVAARSMFSQPSPGSSQKAPNKNARNSRNVPAPNARRARAAREQGLHATHHTRNLDARDALATLASWCLLVLCSGSSRRSLCFSPRVFRRCRGLRASARARLQAGAASRMFSQPSPGSSQKVPETSTRNSRNAPTPNARPARAACFRSLPRDRARKLRTKTLEKLTKRSSSKRPASARSARARAARDPPHSQS